MTRGKRSLVKKAKSGADPSHQALRAKIADPAAQVAFDRLVQYGAQSSVYCMSPGGQGRVQDMRFKAVDEWPFVFTCSRAHLLFSLRSGGVRALGATTNTLAQWFSEVTAVRGGRELTVRIRTLIDAQHVIAHVLDAWANTQPHAHGIPIGITQADVLQAAAAIAAGKAGNQFRESVSWDVVVAGVLYPPQRILGVAARRAAGRELMPGDFAGEAEANCHRVLAELGFEIVRKGDLRAAREATEEHIAQQIRQRKDISPTQQQSLIQARRGQGIFRANLDLYEQACRVTGVMDRRHLCARHIKPWRDCSDVERLDGLNGLLLAPHVDHLFDQGHISFDDDGNLLVSRQLNRIVLKRWGIVVPLQVAPFRAEQKVYLAWHREHVFERPEQGRRRAQR